MSNNFNDIERPITISIGAHFYCSRKVLVLLKKSRTLHGTIYINLTLFICNIRITIYRLLYFLSQDDISSISSLPLRYFNHYSNANSQGSNYNIEKGWQTHTVITWPITTYVYDDISLMLKKSVL